MSKPIELNYWPTPNGWKISIALEEMGLPYTVKLINIGKGEQFAPEFLKISPNNRMPAIVDPEGPDGAPIAIFESGAILLYLARKTGQFYGSSERDRIAVEQWLMWQMGGLGPMAGQAHHFLAYAPTMDPPNDLPYAKDRYRNEVNRLYGVLDKQLGQNEFVAGDFYSIADMAVWPWASLWQKQEQNLSDKPNLQRWLAAVGARPAVRAGQALHLDKRATTATSSDAQKVLFGQKG
ncbi:glutathione S-transferase N-terminal domain-containing protein [Pseudooceanicola sp.]|uniref:glutathione S-transferase N-terminal domain-containing protein n=1 Tax=Pseudooceanicola sp. TaxID=1914328 RepID=UPI00260EB091|nr:glutathione S-transferase N-terminal domain-containing protein [Pseudooceanicola sp.]MDF1854794.1 glutathione S-transferase N-terminal domain-containing protein [Pseudooceanicola sp.]